jgi:hypothetical protein
MATHLHLSTNCIQIAGEGQFLKPSPMPNLGYRSGGPGSIPGTTRKKSSGTGTGSTQPCEYKLRSYMIEK